MMRTFATDQTTSMNYPELIQTHPLFDDMWEYGASIVDDPESNDIRVLNILAEIDIPMLSVGNLNDPDLHLRGWR